MISIRLKKLYRVCLKKTNKMDGFVAGFYYSAFCAFWSEVASWWGRLIRGVAAGFWDLSHAFEMTDWGIEDTDCGCLRSQVGRLGWYTTMSSRQSAVMRDLWLSSEISHMRSRWQVGGLRVRIAGIWGHRLGVWGDIQQCHPDRAQRRGISGLVTTPYCAYISQTVTKTWTHAIKRLKTTIE